MIPLQGPPVRGFLTGKISSKDAQQTLEDTSKAKKKRVAEGSSATESEEALSGMFC